MTLESLAGEKTGLGQETCCCTPSKTATASGVCCANLKDEGDTQVEQMSMVGGLQMYVHHVAISPSCHKPRKLGNIVDAPTSHFRK